MKKYHLFQFALLFVTSVLGSTSFAQSTNRELTKLEKKTTIDSIGSKLQSTYVFPDIAKEMADLLHEKLKKGNYKAISDSI